MSPGTKQVDETVSVPNLLFCSNNKPIGPVALWHIDRQTVGSIYYYYYVRTYVVRIMYNT